MLSGADGGVARHHPAVWVGRFSVAGGARFVTGGGRSKFGSCVGFQGAGGWKRSR